MHDGLDWLNMECEVVGASRAASELKLRAGNSRSVIKTETQANTDFGRHGPSIRNLKITGNNEGALGNYGIEMSSSKSHNIRNCSINDSGDSLITVNDSVTASHHNMFIDLTLVPGTNLATLNRPLIEVSGVANGNNFRRINCFGTQGSRDVLGVIGAISVYDAGGSTVNTWNVFEDIVFQTFSIAAGGAFVTIESAKEITFRNMKLWDPVTQPSGTSTYYRIKRGSGTNTGGHWITDRNPGNFTGSGGTLDSTVEIDDDWCVVDISHQAHDQNVLLKSGALYNDITIHGKSANSTHQGANPMVVPAVVDNSGNDTNTYRIAHGRGRGVMPPRGTTAERGTMDDGFGAAQSGFQWYDTTTNKMTFWNGSAWETVTSS